MPRKNPPANNESRQTASDKVLITIKSLLARQNHPTANEHEAAVCAAKVQALLLKHNLDLTNMDLTGDDQGTAEVIQEAVEMGVGSRDSFEWCLYLSGAVARATFCRPLILVPERKLLFIGDPTDVAVASELYRFLFRQCADLMLASFYEAPAEPATETKVVKVHGIAFAVPSNWKPKKRAENSTEEGYNWCRSYLYGIGLKVGRRLDEDTCLSRAAENAEKVVALVKNKEGLVAQFIATSHQGLRPIKLGKGVKGQEAMLRGYQDGNQVELTRRARIETSIAG